MFANNPMKRKDIEELKKKSDAEYRKMLKEQQARLRVLRFERARGKVKNVQEIRDIRRTVARIATFMNQMPRP